MEQQAAQNLVAAAHQVCPYSRATRGNIDVAITVSTSQPTNEIEEIHR